MFLAYYNKSRYVSLYKNAEEIQKKLSQERSKHEKEELRG